MCACRAPFAEASVGNVPAAASPPAITTVYPSSSCRTLPTTPLVPYATQRARVFVVLIIEPLPLRLRPRLRGAEGHPYRGQIAPATSSRVCALPGDASRGSDS